jgi:hypothetical protein
MAFLLLNSSTVSLLACTASLAVVERMFQRYLSSPRKPDSAQNQKVSGYVNLIQEERFRLSLDDGRSFLFTLGRHASLGMPELEQLKQRHARVQVEFTGEPNQISAVVRAMRPLD